MEAITLTFRVAEPPEGWLLEEEDVPETPLHDAIIELLMLILKHRAAGEASVLVARNLGCRWNPADARVGTDPDVVWIEPAPPEGEDLSTLRVWAPGHTPPRVAVEVVSESDPEKDYLEAPLRCARLGARELWVFDPKGLGPNITGGPFVVQVWRLNHGPQSSSSPQMTRIYDGQGPAYSPELDAWLHVTDDGRRLRLAGDEAGEHLWPTPAEAERSRADAEKSRVEALEARIRALESGHK